MSYVKILDLIEVAISIIRNTKEYCPDYKGFTELKISIAMYKKLLNDGLKKDDIEDFKKCIRETISKLKISKSNHSYEWIENNVNIESGLNAKARLPLSTLYKRSIDNRMVIDNMIKNQTKGLKGKAIEQTITRLKVDYKNIYDQPNIFLLSIIDLFISLYEEKDEDNPFIELRENLKIEIYGRQQQNNIIMDLVDKTTKRFNFEIPTEIREILQDENKIKESVDKIPMENIGRLRDVFSSLDFENMNISSIINFATETMGDEKMGNDVNEALLEMGINPEQKIPAEFLETGTTIINKTKTAIEKNNKSDD